MATASGAKASRPQLDQLLSLLEPGDTLKITRLDRLPSPTCRSPSNSPPSAFILETSAPTPAENSANSSSCNLRYITPRGINQTEHSGSDLITRHRSLHHRSSEAYTTKISAGLQAPELTRTPSRPAGEVLVQSPIPRSGLSFHLSACRM